MFVCVGVARHERQREEEGDTISSVASPTGGKAKWSDVLRFTRAAASSSGYILSARKLRSPGGDR
jgi:hypothetical protein